MTPTRPVPHSARVICVGHTAFDRVYRVSAWPSGSAKVRARGFRESGGGMAANAAAAIAQLGGTAHFWGPVGDDALADAMATELVTFGVDVSGLHRVPGTHSSHSAILVDERGERLIIGVRGAVLTAGAEWLPLTALQGAGALLADVRWPVGARRALEAARALGVSTVLDADTAERDVLHELLPLADHVIFSESGLHGFAARCDALALAEALAPHTRTVAVTRGALGVEWIEAGRPTQIERMAPPRITRAVDTTGAGDVFHGAYALGIAEGMPARLALRFANAAAALKCEREGARSVPMRAEVERVMTAD